MKFSAGDLVLIDDNYYSNINQKSICLILDIINTIEYLGLPEDALQNHDDFIKEVYKVFMRGTISLISPEDILERINEKQAENTR